MPRTLRRWREEAGVSLRDVATKMGFSAAYLSDVELGKRAVTAQIEAFYTEELKGKKQ